MVFSSLIFLLAFLPLNLLCYFAAKKTQTRNVILLLFSLVFYAWGEPLYVLLLIGMSFYCWLFARLVEGAKTPRGKKALLFFAAAGCVGCIGFFKYAGFLCDNVNALAGRAVLSVPRLALPIGISFYTFQLLTYVVDVYRGEVPAQRRFWRVLLYAGLFHQCVAGPIVRYGDIENELTARTSDLNSISRGVSRFAVGLAKKSLLANACGAAADALLLSDAAMADAAAYAENLALLQGRSALTLWIGMAFYMLQIYLDFSAYSDMAIGMGLMCGLHYKENFMYPYVADSVTDFWRRWHISLSTFFRDYVYIPLGGNRKGTARQILNLFIVWSLTGLWHGASWNFVLWGLYFFVFLLLEKFVFGKLLAKTHVLKHLYLLLVVYFGWVLFRFSDLGMLWAVLSGMFRGNGNAAVSYEIRTFALSYIPFFLLCLLACTPLVRNLGTMLKKKAMVNRGAFYLNGALNAVLPAALIVLSVLSLVGDSYNPFLYFQF